MTGAMKGAPRAVGGGAPVGGGVLVLAAALSLACEAIPDRAFTGRVTSHEGFTVVETRDGRVTMLAPDLAVKWDYTPRFPPSAPGVGYPTSHLVCPPAFEREGPVVLTYPLEVHAVDRDSGVRRWKIQRELVLGRQLVVGADCPAVAPDSGVVFCDSKALLLRKHDAKGVPSWVFDLAPFGGPIASPHVVWPDGAIVVRTKANVLVFSPAGQISKVLPWR